MAKEPPVATTFGGNLADPIWKEEQVITESPVISIVD